MTPEEIRYSLMRLIEGNPNISQRGIARELGISLGKANYCLQALIGKGLVKIANFKNSPKKLAYTYLLTPRGIEHKTRLTIEFLAMKMREYERLRTEIARMRREARG